MSKKNERTYLGRQVQHAVTKLDLIQWAGSPIRVTLNASEFTSHCPVTKQPDFATLKIEYSPRRHLIETKSMKLYLWQFRDVAEFNEKLVDRIASDIALQAKPAWVRVTGTFATRGGISVTAVSESYFPT